MKRVLTACLLLASGVAVTRAADVDPAVLEAEAQRVAVIEHARQSAVAVVASGQGGGSGVVISSDGYALSNFHVTMAAGDAMKCGLADGKVYDAVIVGVDPVGDVALLKLFGRDDFPAASLGDSDQVRVGDWAFAVGNPFLLANDFQPTVTYGIISGVHRYQYPSGTLLEYADCLQTDASINPGNSGGPLFNSRGELIGINGRGSFEKRGRVNVGVAYAISINQIKNFLGCLHSGRVVDHATLGARLASQDDGSVIVADILEDSDAYRRGLRYGDEVVRFGGRPIHTVNAFKNVLGIFPKGWRIPLTYRRAGQAHDVLVRLSGVHGTQELLEKIEGRVPIEPGKPQEPPGGRPRLPMPGPGQPDGPQPKDGPEPPAPDAKAHRREPMPHIVQEHFESRRGYANYYFNKLHRDRLWNALVARGDFSSAGGEWVLQGEWVGAGDAEFRIRNDAVGCALPGGQLSLPVDNELSGAADPPGSGGLLAALYVWRRLLVVGPDQFGSIYYYGTAPVAGKDKLAEVLVGTFGGLECSFFCDPDSGRLWLLELVRTTDDDPCELYFSQYQEVDGRDLPHHLEVRYGDALYAAFDLAHFELNPGPEE